MCACEIIFYLFTSRKPVPSRRTVPTHRLGSQGHESDFLHLYILCPLSVLRSDPKLQNRSAVSFTVTLTLILLIYFTNRPPNSLLFGSLAMKQRGEGEVNRATVIREITCNSPDPREGGVVPPSSLLPSPPAAAAALSSI